MTKKKKTSTPVYETPVEGIITRELPVLKTGTDVGYFDYAGEKCTRYTYAFHQLYKRTDESADKGFINEIRNSFSMCDMEYRSCAIDASALRSSEMELDEKRISDIEALKAMMEEDGCTDEDKFKYNNKIACLVHQLNCNAVFGGKMNLRLLTKAYNIIKKAEVRIPKLNEEITVLEEQLSSGTLSRRDYKRVIYQINSKKRSIYQYKINAVNAKKRIPKLKRALKESRILDASLVGEANQKGNRFVEFDLIKGILIFKITNDNRYKVSVLIPNGFREELKKVQELINRKEISVTIRFSKNMIKLQYDVAVVNGYSVDEKSRRAEVKEIKKEGYTEET